MAINHTLFTGQTEPAGEVRSLKGDHGQKALPVHSGKKFIRLRTHRKLKAPNKQTKEI